MKILHGVAGRGEKEKNATSTGSASDGCAAAPLHPWLHPDAPPGNAVKDFLPRKLGFP